MSADEREDTCAAPLPDGQGEACGRPGALGFWCKDCTLTVWACCSAHVDGARQSLAGHVLERHPESLPRVLARIRQDPDQLEYVMRAARRAPEKYARLVEALRMGVA